MILVEHIFMKTFFEHFRMGLYTNLSCVAVEQKIIKMFVINRSLEPCILPKTTLSKTALKKKQEFDILLMKNVQNFFGRLIISFW